MDLVPDWANFLLRSHAKNVIPYAGTAMGVIQTIKSFVEPLIKQLSEKPDLATIALLLVIILISLKILNMLWQTVVFWVRLARTVVFWGGLVGFGLWMYTRGPDGVAEDIQYWFNTWNGEYKYWKEQETLTRMMKPQANGRRGGGIF